MRVRDINRLLLIWGVPSEQGIEEIKKAGLIVLVPEMRPWLFGLKVSDLLKKHKIKHIYVTDNMLGLFFYKKKIDSALFFYKNKNNNRLSGICGSLYFYLLSKLHNVPVKTIKGEEIPPEFFDKNASTIDGRQFVGNDKSVEAKDEEFNIKKVIQ